MKKIIYLLGSVLLLSCTNNEETITTGIQPEQLTHLHNNDSKSWKITHYYSDYGNQILDNDYTTCMKDDVYIFKVNERLGEVLFGDNSCYANYSDVDGETAVVNYTYFSEEGKLYLDFGRGAYSNENNVQTAWLVVLSCDYLSEDKMIFTNGAENDGVGVVFEKL